ncbi:MAG: hypothetical protein ACK2UW_02730 [Anaerolineales bacterium]|jgi:methyl-accepting chemotaxis protein
MTTSRQVTLVVVFVLALVGLLFSLLGIVMVWSVNTPLTKSGQAIVSGLEASVSAAEFLTIRVDAGLDPVENTVDQVSQVVSGLDQTGILKDVLLRVLPDSLTDSLVGQIVDIQTQVLNLYEMIRDINQALIILDRLPFISVPTLDGNRLADAAQELQTSVENLSGEISQTTQQDSSNLETLSGQLQSFGDSLSTWRSLLGEIQSFLNEWSVLLASVKANLPLWIDWISMILTLLLLINVLAWLNLLLVARSFWVNPRLTLGRNLVLAEVQPPDTHAD